MNISNKTHDQRTNIISLDPRILSLEDIALSTSEAHIFVNGLIVRQPDGLMFDPTTKTLYNVEYKTHHSNQKRQIAKKQLKDSKDRLSHIFPEWEIKNIYVHGKYEFSYI